MCSLSFMPDNQENHKTDDEKRRSDEDQPQFKTERRERIRIGIGFSDDLIQGLRYVFTLVNASGGGQDIDGRISLVREIGHCPELLACGNRSLKILPGILY